MIIVRLCKRLYIPVIGWIDRGEEIGLPGSAAERLIEIKFAEIAGDNSPNGTSADEQMQEGE